MTFNLRYARRMTAFEWLSNPDWIDRIADPARGVWVDPWVNVTGSGRGYTVPLTFHYQSGATVSVEVRSPAPGALRFTSGNSGLHLTCIERPVTISESETGLQVITEDLTANFGAGGFETPFLTRPKPHHSANPTSITGRLMQKDTPIGWMECFYLAEETAVYGGGECFRALDLRGRCRTLINRETHTLIGDDLAYLNVPFFWSQAGWAVLINTGGIVGADLGVSSQEVARWAIDGAHLDFVVFGGTPAEILRTYWQLTGWPGAVPDWAFGVWLSRATYISEEEMHRVLDELEAVDARPDVMHVDAWLAGNIFRTLTCEWQADRTRFPAGWTERLRQRNVRTSVWLNPFVQAEAPVGEALRQKGALLTDRNGTPCPTCDRENRWIIDFSHPFAQDWWQEQMRILFRDEAPDTVKLDFGEEIPSQAMGHDGRPGHEIRNAYARMYQAHTHAMLRILQDEGVLSGPVPLFCRSGTHGSQVHPGHWVGDSPATWDGLVSALYAVQSLSLSGFGLVAHDVGGFVSPGTGEIPMRKLDGEPVEFFADIDPELYVRWVQWGALTPLMRLHGLGLREPTAYPEPYRSIAVAAFHLRRQLRVYLAGSYRTGLLEGCPLLRPMPLAYPENADARSADLQYLLGPDILVAPILAPGGSRTFYVPDGKWVSLFDKSIVRGPGWVENTYAIQAFPAYVRGAKEPFGA